MYEIVRYSTRTSGTVPYDVAGQKGSQSGITWIEVEDDNNPDSGVGKTKKGLFTGYNEVNSREPLIGISGNGRNNIAGASYLYVASNQETACMEVKSGYGDLLSLATFEINKDMSIIDFSTNKSFQHEDTVLHNMSLGRFFTENIELARQYRLMGCYMVIYKSLYEGFFAERSYKIWEMNIATSYTQQT